MIQRLAQHRFHLGDLVVGGGALGRLPTHHPGAQRRVAAIGGDIRDRSAALEHVEVLAEGLEVPAHAGPHGLERHRLDPSEVAQRTIAIFGVAGRDAEAAVADDHGADAEQGRGHGVGIPRELDIVVGVRIDDPGRERQALGIDLIAASAYLRADRHDAAALDRNAARERGRAGPVVDSCVLDDEVVHRFAGMVRFAPSQSVRAATRLRKTATYDDRFGPPASTARGSRDVGSTENPS